MSDKTYCRRCGEEYDWYNQEPPEDTSLFWTPKCPACNASMMDTVADETWLDIIGSNLDREHENYEYHRRRFHYHARMCHGRLAGLSVAELVERAQMLDRHDAARTGPSRNRTIAFRIRKQAREQSNG